MNRRIIATSEQPLWVDGEGMDESSDRVDQERDIDRVLWFLDEATQRFAVETKTIGEFM